jgi:hypothetical protein
MSGLQDSQRIIGVELPEKILLTMPRSQQPAIQNFEPEKLLEGAAEA